MTLRLRKGGKNNLFMQLLVLAYLLVAIQIVLFACRFSAYQHLGPILPLAKPWAAWAGVTLTIVPGALAWFAQNHLGLSWRLGIDESSENVMKSEGLYRLVRHPIYSAMILIGVGLFLLMPNILSALIAVLLPVALSMVAAAEEAYLKSIHGERYLRYIAATGKWLPHLRSR